MTSTVRPFSGFNNANTQIQRHNQECDVQNSIFTCKTSFMIHGHSVIRRAEPPSFRCLLSWLPQTGGNDRCARSGKTWIHSSRSWKFIQTIDLVTSRQTREKLQWLYENLMSNNFRRTAFLKKKHDLYSKASRLRILLKKFEAFTCTKRPRIFYTFVNKKSRENYRQIYGKSKASL